MLRSASLCPVLFLALALSGCGGGGGGGDDDGGGNPPATSFTVGGAVTGLSGSVVLRLNGGNDLTVSAAGSFTFSASLANGASYAVSIVAQPANQVCGPGVVNGAGAINGANVTSVAITCANYSIGGTVTGLVGSGLALQLNGANDLAVASPASSFTFPSSVSLGGGILYSVRIKTQPQGQTCTIVDSSGVVTAAAPSVTSAAVACIDNVTDALAGTYLVQSLNGEPATGLRAFVTFHAEGIYMFGLHEDNPDCGFSGRGGVEYGVYRWNQSTHAFEIRNAVIDTNGECGLADGDDRLSGTLIVNADGTLTGSHVDDGEEETFTLAPVTSTAGALTGSWGDNQAFIAYEGDGKYFLAMTRAIAQNTATAPGIEDGCYALSGATASGSYTIDLSASCVVGGAQAAADTNGSVGLSALVGRTLDFVVTGDSMQTTVGGVNALAFIPGTRIMTTTPAASTFAVSGSITGLTGAGLALRLNGETGPTYNVSPPAGDGAFAFPARLQAGAAYRVQFVSPAANPTQICFFATPPVGVIGRSHVTHLAINCLNSAPYTASGSVSGLSGAGLTLRASRNDISYAGALTTFDELAVAANATTFGFSIPANNAFNLGILAQPTGQTCTITRANGFSLGANITGSNIACVNNTTDPLSGAYSTLNEDGDGRLYVNFNADGAYTTALVHDDPDCNIPGDVRNGNGVEYGVFSWDESTGALELLGAPVDTNGDCGFHDNDDLNLTRVGNTIEIREVAGGPVVVAAAAVDSMPGTLVGGWVPEANNGELLVFHADGTFVWAATQEPIGPPSTPIHDGQERGCYMVNDSTVTLTIDAASCQPDGFDPYDLNNAPNGAGGLFRSGVATTPPLPFTLEDDDTLSILGRTFRRTSPN